MLRKLLASKVLGIVACLGIAAGGVTLAVRNGAEDSGSRAGKDAGSWEIATEAPEERFELPGVGMNAAEAPASPAKSGNLHLAPNADLRRPSSTAEPKAPSEPSGAAPNVGGSGAPKGGNEASADESQEQTNSAEAYPDKGVTFTRDEVLIAIDPTGDGGQQDSDDDDAEDEEETEDEDE